MADRHGPALGLGLGVVAELVLALFLVRGGWFGGDGLDYLTRRGTIPGEDIGLFKPWGGHWQTVPILIYRGIFSVFGMRYYLPYVGLVVLVHLALCVLLYLFLTRAGCPRWIGVVTCWLLLFFGAGAEAFLSDGPLPLNLSLLIGLSSLYLGLRRDLVGRTLIVMPLLLVLGVMTSVTGVVVLLPVGLIIFFERDLRTAARVVVPPAVIFLVWFALVGRDGDRVHTGGWSILEIPDFVWSGMKTPLGSVLGLSELGAALLLVAMVAPLVVRDAPLRLRQLAWAGQALALAQLTLSALASLQFGTDQAQAGRYQYIVMLGLLPSVALLLDSLLRLVVRATAGRSGLAAGALGGVVLVSATMHGISLQHGESEFMRVQGTAYRSLAFGTVAAVEAGERLLTHELDVAPLANPDDFALLAAPQIRTKLPPHHTTAAERVGAESDLFVGVGTDTYDLPAPTSVDSQSFNRSLVAGSGCQTYTATSDSPSLLLQTGGGTQFVVTSGSDRVSTRLVRGEVGSDIHTWGASPGKPMVVGVTAKDASLSVAFDAGGQYTICL